jgi:hypothetical protein
MNKNKRSLDFIVIGAQKGGTTSLWQYLRHHPAIAMPERKEEPFFSKTESDRPRSLDDFVEAHFRDIPAGLLLGKATPQYMMGSGGVDVEQIAREISATLPEVRLIALLRDPIERAASHYRMSARRRWEQRTFDAAVVEQLEPGQLTTGRTEATETNSYVVQGEYGRILGIYRSHVPAERLHVELTADLNRKPDEVLDRVLEFLSLPSGYRPDRLGAHHHRGGARKLLDEESFAELREFLEENVWPNLGDEEKRVKSLFAAFCEIWNIDPDDELPTLSAETRARLEAHYEADAERLAELGIAVPWIESWQSKATL